MSKKIDLTGQRFGKLLVLKEDGKIGRYVAWQCQCDCGQIKTIRGDSLRGGTTKSCGCLQKEKAKESIKKNGNNKITVDLVNKTFGRLTVLSLIKKENRSYWHCQCICGNFCDVDTYSLTSGHKVSCGCLHKENMIGKKFGKLTVLEESSLNQKNRCIVYKCQCDCGTICYINGNNLRTGHTISCGCIKSQGEYKIAKLLSEHNIPYEKEKTFDSCKFKETDALAKFDFFVDNSYCIEFDGIQHSQSIEHFGGEEALQKRRAYDEYKTNWCKENGIPLIRIPWYKIQTLTIEDLLLKKESNSESSLQSE